MLLLLFFTKLIALCRLHREEKLLRRVAMVAKFLDLNMPGTAKVEKKKKNSENIDSERLSGTQEQNCSPYFSFMRKWPSLSGNIAEV